MIPEQDKAEIRKRLQQMHGALELLQDTTRDLARKQEELFNAVHYEDWDTHQCRSAYADVHYRIEGVSNALGDAKSDLRHAAHTLRNLTEN